MLNSSPAQLAVLSYAISIQQGTHILRYVAVPTYDRGNAAHVSMSTLGRQAHSLADGERREVELAIDDAAAAIWDLTRDEELAMQRSLREIASPAAASSEALG